MRTSDSVGPATANAYHHLIQPYPRGAGLDSMEAVKVIQNERDNLELIADIIDKEGIKDKVDFWKGDLCEGQIWLQDSDPVLAKKKLIVISA